MLETGVFGRFHVKNELHAIMDKYRLSEKMLVLLINKSK